jgi:hypothetical protein
MTEVRDRNTCHAYVGSITLPFLQEKFESLTKLAVEKLGGGSQEFVINLPVNAEGQKLKHCYIWWDDAEVVDYLVENHPTVRVSFQGKNLEVPLGR